GRVLGLAADDDVLRGFEIDHRGRRVLADRTLEHDRAPARVDVRDAGIGRAQVDSVGSHVTSYRLRRFWGITGNVRGVTGNVLVKASLNPAAYHPGLALVKTYARHVRHGVVPVELVADHHPQWAMPVALGRIAGLGREDLDAAAVQDLRDVLGKGPHQLPVL